jgi:hypothetical protein
MGVNDEHHAKATHESDAELWSHAHHGTQRLDPGQMLTREEREWAWGRANDIDDADERDRMADKCR